MGASDGYTLVRQRNASRDDALHERCFICGIRGPEFDRIGIMFDYHTRFEHNPLHYLSAYCRLVSKCVVECSPVGFSPYGADRSSCCLCDLQESVVILGHRIIDCRLLAVLLEAQLGRPAAVLPNEHVRSLSLRSFSLRSFQRGCVPVYFPLFSVCLSVYADPQTAGRTLLH